MGLTELHPTLLRESVNSHFTCQTVYKVREYWNLLKVDLREAKTSQNFTKSKYENKCNRTPAKQ